MKMKPLLNYKGNRYPTLKQYFGRKRTISVMRGMLLLGALSALATLSGCFNSAS
jgi:hypothetical protein